MGWVSHPARGRCFAAHEWLHSAANRSEAEMEGHENQIIPSNKNGEENGRPRQCVQVAGQQNAAPPWLPANSSSDKNDTLRSPFGYGRLPQSKACDATHPETFFQSSGVRQVGSAETQWPGAISRRERSMPMVSS
jgi:hypothetical protein